MLPALREFTYLTAPSAATYRTLTRLFYDAHLGQRHTLPPEEVLAGARALGLDLLPEALLLDLEQLVAWGNLGRRRDTRRVGSLAEYTRRRDLYYATARGLAIEGFLEAGLDAAEESMAVGAGIVSGMEAQWTRLSEPVTSGAPEDLEAAWANLQRDFLALSGDVRALALNLERRLSLEALDDFLEFKEAVRSYIERLAGELAGPGRRLRDGLLALNAEQEAWLLGTLVRVRSGRLTRGAGVMDAEQAERATRREWLALRGWFSRSADHGDGLEYGVTALRGAVTRVLAFVDAVHRTRELGLGRAGELAALAAQLDQLPDAATAREQLSVRVGLSAPLHAPGGSTAEPVQDTWQEASEQVLLNAVQRGRVTERHSADVGEISREARRAARDALRAERERQKALLALFRNGQLDLTELDLPDGRMLPDVLEWLSAGLSADAEMLEAEAADGPGGVTSGPEGHQVRVILNAEPARLKVPDGTLWIERGATVRLLDLLQAADDRSAMDQLESV
ncbi:DUF2397 family protein [Deinococcus altitudinis]|uniref:DUF2397 family protein n=1 Tax=Deinococcus altitudinis TaxID=468914 RepID=UPI0038912F00